MDRPAGDVARFCPVCRQLEVHEFLEQHVGVVMYLGLGVELPLCPKRYIGDWVRCSDCGLKQPTARDTPILPAGSSMKDMLDVLPRVLRERFEERLELEQRIVAGESIETDVRERLLEEPFRAASHRLHTTIWLKINTSIIVIGLFVGFAGPMMIWSSITNQLIPRWFMALMAAGPVVLIGGGFWCLRKVVELARRREIGLVRRALRPLEPTEEELLAAIRRLRRGNVELAKRVKAKRLAQLVREAEPA